MKYLEIEIKKFYFNMKHYGLQFIINQLVYSLLYSIHPRKQSLAILNSRTNNF